MSFAIALALTEAMPITLSLRMKVFALFATLLFPFVCRGAEQITIGDQALTIPLTEGFSRFDGINAQTDALMEKSLPPSKRL